MCSRLIKVWVINHNITGEDMRVVASEAISEDLTLKVVTGENEDLAERLDIVLENGYFAYLAFYKGKYLPTSIWGLDGEEDKEDMISTMKEEADWHRANPAMIGNTLISTI